VRVLAGRLKAPKAVAVDAAGNVYVADTGKLDNPRGIALDSAGRLLVADTGHQRVARFDTRTGAGGAWIVHNGRAANGDVAVVRYNADGKAIGFIGYGQSSRSAACPTRRTSP
jgi:DNA-binding beta-propeller fold protein YncE